MRHLEDRRRIGSEDVRRILEPNALAQGYIDARVVELQEKRDLALSLLAKIPAARSAIGGI